MIRTEHVDDQLEIERARLAAHAAELRASVAAGASYRERLIAEGLLVPRGEPARGLVLVLAAVLPLAGPYKAVPRTTTPEELEACEARQEVERRWYQP